MIEAYLGALNAGDPDAVAALVAEDFVNEHTSTAASGLVGRVAYRARLPSFLGEFPELRYEVEDLLVDGDRAAVAYRMTARYRGTTPVALRGMFRFRVEDGVVAARTDYFDSADFARQVSGG